VQVGRSSEYQWCSLDGVHTCNSEELNCCKTKSGRLSGEHCNAFGNCRLLKRFIRSGKSEIAAQSEVKIGGVIGGEVPAACEGLQIDIGPEVLGFDADGQGLEKTHVFGNLLLGDSLALAEGDEDAIGNFERPDFRNDGVVTREFLQDLATVRSILGRIARKAP
jgi:hypothetical protein